MPSTHQLIALGAVLVVAASGIALAETMSDHHAMEPGQTQEIMRSGDHPMGSPEMQKMMRQHVMPMGAPAGVAESPYAGQQSRSIKALSEEDITALQNGDGMGMAKAAELNSYPGPRHVLALVKELRLTESQADLMTALRDRMSAAARPLGAELIDRAETTTICNIQGRLRAVHLAAHLETRTILTPEQVAQYDQLRGYGR